MNVARLYSFLKLLIITSSIALFGCIGGGTGEPSADSPSVDSPTIVAPSDPELNDSDETENSPSVNIITVSGKA